MYMIRSTMSAFIAMIAASPLVHAAPVTVTPNAPVLLEAPAGGFDYMAGDMKYDRIFASHSRANGISVLSTKENKGADIDVGCQMNGVAIDLKGKKSTLRAEARKC